ncbi:uncharacterized protein MEPE_01406 [Melanopsichium pennsylvanicum]|uniref:Caffeine-induced death protein 2 n=2 Tax=Melanopsichium pennsylvanicum TaxID=63383 RepID=A0AAJ4XHP6_9BASI|nr:conserved hypothetical protein [Melanopsichium pennsylvanicum 4]SNX82700.1 uncharacterized protein MEPE_01406 [Melanopsichium pennsylvanicum]
MSTWVSPSLSRFNRKSTDAATATQPSNTDASSAPTSTPYAPQYETVDLGSASVLKPLTPPSVTNLLPSTCLNIREFKELLRQYRALDDGITTRINRSFARSRALGQSTSPSLLSGNAKSDSVQDLGTSTYSTPAPGACVEFWNELVAVWSGREDAVRFCINVADQAANPTLPPLTAVDSNVPTSDRILDADYKPSLNPKTKSSASSQIRWSRAENTAETLARQLHNELKVESIIRARSLDAFKSRCKFFTPPPRMGAQGERERAMWEGKPTPLERASAEGRLNV